MQQQQRLKKANRMDMTVMEAKLLSAVLAQLQGQLKSLPPPPHLAAAFKQRVAEGLQLPAAP
jgi:hypothetical protein